MAMSYEDPDSKGYGSRKKKKKPSKQPQDQKFIKAKRLSQMLAREELDGPAYKTTLAVLGDPQMRALEDGPKISICYKAFPGVPVLTFSRKGGSLAVGIADVYCGNNVGGRAPGRLLEILSEVGQDAYVRGSDGRVLFTSVMPCKKYGGQPGPELKGLILSKGEQVGLDDSLDRRCADFRFEAGLDEGEVKEWIPKLTAMRFDVYLWAGGREPLAVIRPGDKHVELTYAKGTHYHAAQEARRILMDLEYSVDVSR